MYKDKEKQRLANKAAKERYKAKQGIPSKGIPVEGIPQNVTQGIPKPKRGKDIKCFEDLPPDVQAAILETSKDKAEESRRTAIAINYQHIFPHRYYPGNAI